MYVYIAMYVYAHVINHTVMDRDLQVYTGELHHAYTMCLVSRGFTFFLLQIDKSSTLSNAETFPVRLSTALFVVTCDELAGFTDTSIAVIMI